RQEVDEPPARAAADLEDAIAGARVEPGAMEQVGGVAHARRVVQRRRRAPQRVAIVVVVARSSCELAANARGLGVEVGATSGGAVVDGCCHAAPRPDDGDHRSMTSRTRVAAWPSHLSGTRAPDFGPARNAASTAAAFGSTSRFVPCSTVTG